MACGGNIAARLVSKADCDHDGVAELFRKLGI